jgi:hypothetical protein
MSWSYSADLENNIIDQLRFLIGDTNPEEPILQDEEIEFLASKYGNNSNLLKYQLFRHVATIFARDIKRSLGPQSEDPTKRLEYFTEQAEYYKKRILQAGLSLPKYAHPKTFIRGGHSNPPNKGGGSFV